MELDLFSLQGVAIEKDLPQVDLYSLQGVVIEKTPPSSNVARVALTVAQRSSRTAQLAGTRLVVAQQSDGFVSLPLDIAPLDHVKKMIQLKASVTLDWNLYTLSKPRRDQTGAVNRTLVDLIPSFDAPTRLIHTLAYSRRPIGSLSSLKLTPASYANLDAVVAAIRAKGILISIGDLDTTKSYVNAVTMLLVANVDSYFFHAGSVTFGREPTLAETFAVTNLNGFQPA